MSFLRRAEESMNGFLTLSHHSWVDDNIKLKNSKRKVTIFRDYIQNHEVCTILAIIGTDVSDQISFTLFYNDSIFPSHRNSN